MTIPRRLAKLAAGAALGIGLLAGSAACTSTGAGSSVSYTPAAYGQQVGKNFDCYYVSSPAEVTDLINAGRCPAGSIPTPMPLSWEESYWSYYSSPAYYDTYMPPASRSHYASVTVARFSTTYGKQIAASSSKALYRSSSGSTVSGSSVKFGTTGTSGGSGTSKTVHGGGSARGATACSLTLTVLTDSGSGSSSHGGGSARSGSSGSGSTGTHSGSGSHGGC